MSQKLFRVIVEGTTLIAVRSIRQISSMPTNDVWPGFCKESIKHEPGSKSEEFVSYSAQKQTRQVEAYPWTKERQHQRR
jgi:hypothetical protein